MLPLWPQGRNPSLPLPDFWWFSSNFCCFLACTYSPSISTSIIISSPTCLCVYGQIRLFSERQRQYWIKDQHYSIKTCLTNYTRDNSISKAGHRSENFNVSFEGTWFHLKQDFFCHKPSECICVSLVLNFLFYSRAFSSFLLDYLSILIS